MILVFECKHCCKANRIKNMAFDRAELLKKINRVNSFSCKKCKFKTDYIINDIRASYGILYKILLLGTVISTILLVYWSINLVEFKKMTVQTPYLIPVISLIPSLFFFNWLINEKKKIRTFNKFKL